MKKGLFILFMCIVSLNGDYKLVLTDINGNQTEECLKSYSFSNTLESIANQENAINDIYSTKETLTNKVFMGKPVYRKVLPIDDYHVPISPNAVYKNTQVISEDLDEITYYTYIGIENGEKIFTPADSFYTANWSKWGWCTKSTKTCSLGIRQNNTSVPAYDITNLKFTVEYTKTSNTPTNIFKSYLHYTLSSSTTNEVITKDMKNIGVQLLEGYSYDSSINSCKKN